MGIATLFTLLLATMPSSLVSATAEYTEDCCVNFQDARCLACLLKVPVASFCAVSPNNLGCTPTSSPSNPPTVVPTSLPTSHPTQNQLQELQNEVDELKQTVKDLSAKVLASPTAVPSVHPTLSPTRISDTIECKTVEISTGNAAELSRWWAVADDEAARHNLPVWRNMAKTGLIYFDGTKWKIEEDDVLLSRVDDSLIPTQSHQIWSVEKHGNRNLPAKIVIEITCRDSLVTAGPTEPPTVSPTTSSPSKAPTPAPSEIGLRLGQEWTTTSSTDMAPHLNSFCFLTSVQIYSAQSQGKYGRCVIRQNGSKWQLVSECNYNSDLTPHCKARCITFA